MTYSSVSVLLGPVPAPPLDAIPLLVGTAFSVTNKDMDTRFWGPSGWKLIHLVATNPVRDEAHGRAVSAWLALLPFVLPCKYCRASLSDYYKALPLTMEILHDPERFGYWAYEIHNRVNGKLRGQGLLTDPDPAWSEVRERYAALYKGLCKTSPLLGWDFLTSVAYTTPGSDYVPTPMPDLPEELSEADKKAMKPAERNRYNLMTREERLPYLEAWWEIFPSILPCEAWQQAWTAAQKKAGRVPLSRGRKAVVQWMWAVERGVCGELRCPTPHASLGDLRQTVGAFESGCGKARRGKTCRANKEARRARVRTLRQSRGSQTQRNHNHVEVL